MKNKYNKENLLKAVENSYTISDVCRYFNIGTKGNNPKTINKYLEFYNIDTSHFLDKEVQLNKLHFRNKINIEDILIENSTYTNNFYLKKRIIESKLLDYNCNICSEGPTWRGKTLVLQLDHINGINNDNRIENLRFLCPNCHSQTDTFCGKHKGRKFKLEEERKRNNGRTDNEVKDKFNRRKVIRPSTSELVILIKKHGFKGVGLKFNVSDNTIRKWCKEYKLPTLIKFYK